MTIGKQILSEVQELLKNFQFSSYSFITTALREIATWDKFEWLSIEDTSTITFAASTAEYDISSLNIRQILNISVVDSGLYNVLEPITYEKETSLLSSPAAEGIPKYYRLVNGTFATIKVTPIPDQTYSVAVNYIKDTLSVSENSVIPIPKNYEFILVKLSAANVLESSEEAAKQAVGARYRQQAESMIYRLARDSSPAKSGAIERSKVEFII
jgi:hypothetical protein